MRACARLQETERHLATLGSGDSNAGECLPPPDIKQYVERDQCGAPLHSGRSTKFGQSAGWFFTGVATSVWVDTPDEEVARTLAACRQDPEATPHPSVVARLAETVRSVGFVCLRHALPVEWVDACQEAFEPRMEQYIRKVSPNDPKTRVPPFSLPPRVGA